MSTEITVYETVNNVTVYEDVTNINVSDEVVNIAIDQSTEETVVTISNDQGLQGPTGATGPTGPTGPQGPQGDPGVIQSITAGDATISIGGTATNPTISVPDNTVDAATAISASYASFAGGVSATNISGTIDSSQVTGVAKLASANAFTVGGHTITQQNNTTVGLSIFRFSSSSTWLQNWNNASFMSAAGMLSVTTYGGQYGGSLNIGTISPVNAAIAVRGNVGQVADYVQYQGAGVSTIQGGRNANAQTWSGSTAPTTHSVGSLASWGSGGTGTVQITFSANHNLAVGDIIVIPTASPTALQTTGALVTTVVSPTAVQYASASGSGGGSASGTVFTYPQASITARSAATRGLILRGGATTAAGFANPFSVQDSLGTSLLQITSAGNIQANGLQTINSLATIGEENAGARVRLTSATATPSAFTSGGTIFVQSNSLRYLGNSGTAQQILAGDGSGALTFNRLTTNKAAVTATTLQNIFPTGSSTLTLEPNTSYAFRLVGAINRTIATASLLSVRLTMSSAPATYVGSVYTLSPTAGATALHTTNSTSTEAQIDVSQAGGTALTTLRFFYEGFFTTSATGGTLIPQYVQNANAGIVMQAGTYFELIKVSSTAGAWS